MIPNVATEPGLVYDHVDQAARTAATEEEAERERQGRQQAERDAAVARLERQNIAGSVKQVVDYMLELDPTLTEQQALDRVVAEFDDLRELSADLEDQLAGLRTYSDVAELNALGDPGVAGLGLSYSSALTRALEGAWAERDGRHIIRAAIKPASPSSQPPSKAVRPSRLRTTPFRSAPRLPPHFSGRTKKRIRDILGYTGI